MRGPLHLLGSRGDDRLSLSGRGKLPQAKSEVVEIAGLYWHFVDVVWIVIFTVVYLIPSPHKGFS